MADLIFKHSSFYAFSNCYNYLHSHNSHSRNFLTDKRLSDVYYAFEMSKYIVEIY
jgi:hypothetical protein